MSLLTAAIKTTHILSLNTSLRFLSFLFFLVTSVKAQWTTWIWETWIVICSREEKPGDKQIKWWEDLAFIEFWYLIITSLFWIKLAAIGNKQSEKCNDSADWLFLSSFSTLWTKTCCLLPCKTYSQILTQLIHLNSVINLPLLISHSARKYCLVTFK